MTLRPTYPYSAPKCKKTRYGRDLVPYILHCQKVLGLLVSCIVILCVEFVVIDCCSTSLYCAFQPVVALINYLVTLPTKSTARSILSPVCIVVKKIFTTMASVYEACSNGSGVTALSVHFISARQHAERAICYRPSVRLSVCLSVRHTGGSVKNG